ncbi:FixH family protein [Kitasatospora sp. MAP5-34]|uniref:FixH family protein n=1 Tax=Kitasatospora sp. MAP5-34 TaxID=3035102 RepID=UPI0024765459|nr:FixH family protein [Kitasatospora sp. MAP5-34]MDH6580227.1 hypothetical protein [Kitasatospora sp. MAP5-34]
MTVPALRVQAAVSAAVVAVVLLLTCWPLHHGSAGVQLSGASADYTVQVRLPRPSAAAGQADITVDRRDHAPVELERVTLAAVMPSMGHAMPALTAEPAGPGRYQTHGQLFLMAGSWQLTVSLNGPSGTETVTVPVAVSAV